MLTLVRDAVEDEHWRGAVERRSLRSRCVW
jgi:hypothetical protein